MAALRYATMVVALVAYFVSGIGLTCFNKWLLGSRWYGFGFPVTLILCHMLTNFIFAAAVISSCLRTQLQSSSFHPRRLPFSLFLQRFVPIGVLFALDITLTNVSFKYIPVALTEVIKGFVPAAIMMHEMASRHMRGLQSRSLYPKSCVVFMLSLGIALTSYGEVDFNWTGCIAAVGALCAAVAKLILLERLLGEQEVTYKPVTSNGLDERAGEEAVTNGVPQHQQQSYPDDVTLQHNGAQLKKMPQLPSSGYNGAVHDPPSHEEETAADGDLRRRSPPVSRPDSGSELPALALTSASGKAVSSAAMPIVAKRSHRVVRPEVRRLHPMLSLFYFAPVAAFVLVPTFFALDYPTLMHPQAGALSFVSSSDVVIGTGLLILFGAVMAFALNVSELFVVQSTSALTLCVVATVKFLLVVVLSSLAFQQHMSPINIFGCCVSIIGIAGYNVIKVREMQQTEEEDSAAAMQQQQHVSGSAAKTEQTAPPHKQQHSNAAVTSAAVTPASHVNGHSRSALIRSGFARAKARVKRWATDRRRSQQYQKVDDDGHSEPFDVDDLDVSAAGAAEPDDLPPPPPSHAEV